MTTGIKGAKQWQFWKNAHQEICVDTWGVDTKNQCCMKKEDRMCFSFAATGELQLKCLSTVCLVRKSCQTGGPLEGIVYCTGDQETEDSKILKTTCKQDEDFLKKLKTSPNAYSKICHIMLYYRNGATFLSLFFISSFS